MDWSEILEKGLQLVLLVLSSVVTWGLTKWIKRNNVSYVEREVIVALQTGVDTAYEDFVRETKTAAVDGQLSMAERQRARNRAFAIAKETATAAARRLLTNWDRRKVDATITDLVKDAKLK